jgi:tetratricopeptide (TPR) repeat protein
VNAAVAIARSGDLAHAEQELSRLAQLYPRDPVVRTALGQLQIQLGEIKAGISSFQAVLHLDSSSPDAHVNLGIALAADGDLTGALRQASAALALAPGSADAHLLKGRVLANVAKEQEARVELNDVLTVHPDSVLALRALWQVDQKLGHTSALISTLNRYVVLVPEDGDGWLQLRKAYMTVGKDMDAVPALRRAVALEPNSSEALFALSRALRSNNPEDSKRLAAHVAALSSDQHLCDELHLLGAEGNQALEQGTYRDAIELFKKAVSVCGECADAADLH